VKRINGVTISGVDAGGVVLGPPFSFSKPSDSYYKDIKIGYDNNADDDIADAGDDIAIDEPLDDDELSPGHDHNGNLTDDGVFKYVFDAWNP
jgi:hypothetical protein